jgi:hypothetical protein
MRRESDLSGSRGRAGRLLLFKRVVRFDRTPCREIRE